MMVSAGTAGSLEIIPPAKLFLTAMDCATLEAVKVALKRLPNVQIEEGQSDNRGFTVIMQNWIKYQVDSTIYERVKRLRCKRRGEEKRKRGEKEEIPPFPPKPLPSASRFQKPTAQEVTDYAKSIGFVLDGQYFIDRYDAAGWVWGKARHPIRDWKAVVRTWKTNEKKYDQEAKGYGGTERKSVFNWATDESGKARPRFGYTGLREASPTARKVLDGIRDLRVPETPRPAEPQASSGDCEPIGGGSRVDG
jgi:hypothetical protein